DKRTRRRNMNARMDLAALEPAAYKAMLGRPPGKHSGPRGSRPKVGDHQEPARGGPGVAPRENTAALGEADGRSATTKSRLVAPRENTAALGEADRRSATTKSRLAGVRGSPP